MAGRIFRIGARGSKLSQIQANSVIDLLRKSNLTAKYASVIIKTSGDIDILSPMHKIGGVGAFTRQIEGALLAGEIDIAVHSAKDLPSRNTDGLTIAAVPERIRCEDALISNNDLTFDKIKAKSVIGTSSPRRRAMLLNARADLQVSDIRGNVETRIAKMRDGKYSAIVLALAGLSRMGLADSALEIFPPEKFIPAACQGTLAIQTRIDDTEILGIIKEIDHERSHRCLDIERALLSRLNAGCNVAIGAWGRYIGDKIKLSAAVLDKDGKKRIDAEYEILSNEQNDGLVDHVYRQLVSQGAIDLIEDYEKEA